MATSLASLPTSFCLNHVDECCKRSPTKPSLSSYHPAAKRSLMGHSLRCHEFSSTARRFVVMAATGGSRKSKESQPSWANPDSDEPPPWARDEGGSSSSTSQESFEVPFFVYLLASAITAIAAVCLLSFSVTSDYTDSYQRCLFLCIFWSLVDWFCF